MWSYKGLKYEVRGLACSQLMVMFNGLSMVVWGPMMFSGTTRGANIQAFRVLLIGLRVALDGPMVLSKIIRGAVQTRWVLFSGL